MIKVFNFKKQISFLALLLLILSFITISIACKGDLNPDDTNQSQETNIEEEGDSKPEQTTETENNTITANQFFWGTWVRMDNGKEYEVLESSVKQGNNTYIITFSDENSLTAQSLGTFQKQSDIVIICNKIPYFRNGGTNLEYSLKLVGFASEGRYAARAAASAMSGVKGRGKSSKYKEFTSEGESDENGKIKLTAPTVNDPQTVTITMGTDSIVIPDLKITNSGDYMGTVALVKPDEYNLKITGDISNKDNGYLYGNNAKSYDMTISITNISSNKCSASGCAISSEDPNLKLSSSEYNLDGVSISTLDKGATKKITVSVSYGQLSEPYVDTGITVKIKNPMTKQEWNDYIPLRFYKGIFPVTVAAKNPENNKNAALNGFIIYPDGNNQFFAIPHNQSKVLYVPTFESTKNYMLVFSGATVSSTLFNSTEMYYTVVTGSTTPRTVVTDGMDAIETYIPFGGNNHSEANAFEVKESFEAYLNEGEIDYYTIAADNTEFFTPSGKSFWCVSYENDKGESPSPIFVQDGGTLLSSQLPDLTSDGYNFLGWYSGTTKVAAGSYKIQDDIILTAKWQLESYPVSYNLNGGTNNSVNPSSYTIESSLIDLKAPVKNNYDFAGWFVSESLIGRVVESIGGGTTGEITLYAKWNPTKYSITYNLNGGTNAVENPANYTVESKTIMLAVPQKEGYVFGGWYTDSSFSETKQTQITKGSSGNKTYYAKWLNKCIVQFQTQYGTAPEAIVIGEGETFTEDQLPVLTSDNYFFTGWYDGETLVKAASYVVKNGLTLTARWRAKCTVSYVSEHGNVPQTFVVAGGTKITAENLPTLKYRGWKFLGWYTNSSYDEDKKVVAGQTIVISITLYAKWEEISDGFIFIEGGTVVGSSSYNQAIIGAFPEGRTVTLSSFYMSDHELTKGEYDQYCCYTESSPSSDYGLGTNYPAYYVSWYDALVYCNLKSMAEGLTPCYALSGETDPKKWEGIKASNGKYSCSYKNTDSNWDSIICNMTANGYRLPTEAEWEYAARGGQKTYGTAAFTNYFAGATTTDYASSTNSSLDPVAWYTNNSDGKTHEVKKKNPNALGLYDMSGNVWEWCWDWYYGISNTETVTDPCGASSGTFRVIRGGVWKRSAVECSVSYRGNNFPYGRYNSCGFRLVRSAQ